MKNKSLLVVMLSLLGTWPSGCGGTLGGNPERSGGTRVSFAIADAPIDDAQHVYVTIRAVELLNASGTWLSIPVATEEFDLLQLRNGDRRDIVEEFGIEPGTYSETRLVLSEDSPSRLVDSSGNSYELKVPSGSESGLKIASPITIGSDENARFGFDFDLRKSIHSAGNSDKYILKPVLRLLRDDETGSIAGQAPGQSLVCAYDSDATTVEPDCEEAVASTIAEADSSYQISLLPAGTYKVALVQNGAITKTIEASEVSANATSTVDFNP